MLQLYYHQNSDLGIIRAKAEVSGRLILFVFLQPMHLMFQKFSLRLTKAQVLPEANALAKGLVVSEASSGNLLHGMLKICQQTCGILNDLLGTLESPLDIEMFLPNPESLMV